jgi:hypothetical protein
MFATDRLRRWRKKHCYQHSGFIYPPTNFYPAANLDEKLDFPGFSCKHLTE